MGVVSVAVQQRRKLLREGLALLLDAERNIDVVGMAADDRELLQLCASAVPNVVLLESESEEWDAGQLIGTVRAQCVDVRVIGMCRTESQVLSPGARNAGLVDMVSYASGVGGLVQAIRAADGVTVGRYRGGVATASRRRPAMALTSRERQVLQQIGLGGTTTTIAVRLGITPKTVESHKQRMFTKLGVQNQSHAVAVAMRAGLLGFDLLAGDAWR